MNTLPLEDELFFMSNLYPKHTGLPFVLWISTGIGVQHDIRVKVSRGPKARPAEMISVGLRPNVHVIDGELSSAEVASLTRWVDLNLAVLLDYWNAELDTADALARLKILGAWAPQCVMTMREAIICRSSRSYLRDYAGWAEDTAQAILEQRWWDIDRAALADEVLDLGKRIESKMESRLRVLLAHLLKQRYQPERETRSWQLTIEEQRSRAWQLLDENPSLKPSLRKLYSRAYSAARYKAARETGLDLTTFPDDLVFTESEIWGEKTL